MSATAAIRIGVSEARYARERAAGRRWCWHHRVFHDRTAFGRDTSRHDGVARLCRLAQTTRLRVGFRRAGGAT